MRVSKCNADSFPPAEVMGMSPSVDLGSRFWTRSLTFLALFQAAHILSRHPFAQNETMINHKKCFVVTEKLPVFIFLFLD